MVKHMAFVAYSVKDVPRAAAFYRDVVGLRPGATEFGDQWVEFEVGDTTFGIGNGESIGIAPGSQFSAAFEVDDVAAMRTRLLALSVPVSDLSDSPVCVSCFVTDPDGNRFALHQRTA
jgi:catechol 2,3-dioxygenase-like lactoylglutathione lyase family enzyme